MKNFGELRKLLRGDVKRNFEVARRASANLTKALPAAKAVYRMLNKAGIVEPYAFCGASGIVYFSARIEVDSFKSAELVRVLESAIAILGEKGLASSDYAEMGVREYKIGSENVKLEVNAKLKGEGSPLCRRVKVGEEVSVIEKFKFVCD